MASELRSLKIASAISKTLSQIFHHDFCYSVSIAEVRVNKDLRYCDVFLYDDDKINIDNINKVSGFLRHKLTKHIVLRHIPKLRFHIVDINMFSVVNSLLETEKDVQDCK